MPQLGTSPGKFKNPFTFYFIRMEATMQTLQSKIKLLGDENPDDENRKTIASIIHTELNRMINLFALKSSLLRKYPLIGAPLLVQLAALVAVFSPIALSLNPFEGMNPQISCKMHDVLLDFRTRTVMARLHKLRSIVWFIETLRKRDKASLINVISLPYNRYGYNLTNPPIVECDLDCDLYGMDSTDACVRDEFDAGIYSGQNFGTQTCLEDYAAFLRHRVEKLFPIELLSSLCIDRKPQQSTGNCKKLVLELFEKSYEFIVFVFNRLWVAYDSFDQCILLRR